MKTKRPGQSVLLLLDVIDILDEFSVPYAIIGAFAVSFYGVVRASVDADAMISLSSGAVEKGLMGRFHRLGLKTVLRKGDARDPIGAVINVEDKFGNRVDLLMKIRGVSEESFQRTVEAKFKNRKIFLVGIEDLIAMKIFAGSPKDLSDVVGVLKVSHDRIDRVLLKELMKDYGKNGLRKLESLLKEAFSK